VLAASGQKVDLQMVLDAEGYRPQSEKEMIQRRRRLDALTGNIAMTASRSVSPKREEQARKEQILTNPVKGILGRAARGEGHQSCRG
jgi:hypothetical protein